MVEGSGKKEDERREKKEGKKRKDKRRRREEEGRTKGGANKERTKSTKKWLSSVSYRLSLFSSLII